MKLKSQTNEQCDFFQGQGNSKIDTQLQWSCASFFCSFSRNLFDDSGSPVSNLSIQNCKE